MKKDEKQAVVDIFQLVLIQLRNVAPGYITGICGIMWKLCIDRQITFEDYKIGSKYMACNRPKRGIHYSKERKSSMYWWEPDSREPRIAWLNSRIKLLSNGK